MFTISLTVQLTRDTGRMSKLSLPCSLLLLQSAEYVMKVHKRGAARVPEAGPGPKCAHQPGPHQSWSGDQSIPHSSPDSAPTPGTLQVTVTCGDKSKGLQTSTLLSTSQNCCISSTDSCWHCALYCRPSLSCTTPASVLHLL